MKIENYGVGKRCTEVMRRLLIAEEEGRLPDTLKRVIILPIPSSKDGVHVTGSERGVSEVLADVGPGCLISGYAIPEREAELAKARGAQVFDASLCEDFMLINSRISAIGALGYILSEIGRVPSDVCFGIVGYGRIGKELVRMLMFLGGRVKVYTSREITRLQLGECGVESLYTDYSEGLVLDGVDVLINTAPTSLTSSFPSGRIPNGVSVIELASGNNFGDIEGIIRLPGIPDKMYPSSAASAYYDAIENYIKEVF